eukprot:3806060-Prymnesium_polylepis.1
MPSRPLKTSTESTPRHEHAHEKRAYNGHGHHADALGEGAQTDWRREPALAGDPSFAAPGAAQLL